MATRVYEDTNSSRIRKVSYWLGNLVSLMAEFVYRKKSVVQRLKKVILTKGGVIGLYRGILPGSLRSFVANGCAMVVMSFAQKKVTDWGLRS